MFWGPNGQIRCEVCVKQLPLGADKHWLLLCGTLLPLCFEHRCQLLVLDTRRFVSAAQAPVFSRQPRLPSPFGQFVYTFPLFRRAAGALLLRVTTPSGENCSL